MDRLVETYRLDIESNEEQIQQLEKFRNDYVSVDKLLETMPQTLNPRVLIPMGSKCGFFYGHLKHTNEILVHLGENYFSKMTASQARLIVSKRINELDDQIGLLRGQKKHMEEKLDIAEELNPKNTVSQEIKEPYSESAEKEWMEKHRASVAREREAAKKEREQAKLSSSEEDPLAKLLSIKIDNDNDEQESPALEHKLVLVDKRVTWESNGEETGPENAVNRIRFRHSTSPSEQPSADEIIQSPADIYIKFESNSKQQLKSILKNKVPEKPVTGAVMQPVEAPSQSFPPPSTAVSDKVIERSPAPLSEIAQTNLSTGPTRVTSRFRKERNIQS